MWFVSRSKRAEFLSNILRMEQWCDEHIRVFSSSFRCSICKSESKVIVLYNRKILCGPSKVSLLLHGVSTTMHDFWRISKKDILRYTALLYESVYQIFSSLLLYLTFLCNIFMYSRLHFRCGRLQMILILSSCTKILMDFASSR